ncbi:MAG TPA: hypothetical protein VIL34_22080 [Actinopolymorphaceae bacterium]
MGPRQLKGRTRGNAAALVLGLLCCALALTWLLVQSPLLNLDDLGWLLPLVFIVAGAAGIAMTMRRPRR